MNEAEVRKKLQAFIFNDLLRRPARAVADDEPLISGGLLDSFALAQIGVFVEKAFGLYIPDTELTAERMDTLDAMVARIVGES